MWLYAATCIGIHYPEKCGSRCQCAGIPVLGLRVQGSRFKMCPPCTCTLWKLVPHAHAHLGSVAFCTCTLGRECPSTVLSAAATLLKQERYNSRHLAINWQRFPHICFAYALSNTWPRQAGGQMPNECAECSPLLAANASRHNLLFISTHPAAESIACSCKVC